MIPRGLVGDIRAGPRAVYLSRVEGAGTPFGTNSRPGAVPLADLPDSTDRHTTVTGRSPLSSGQRVRFGVAPS